MQSRWLVRRRAVAGLAAMGALAFGLWSRVVPGAALAGEAATWAFRPAIDDFRAGALLDLRSLNEPVAGQSGYIRTDGNGGFLRGDGQPIRFWAVNTHVGRERPFRPRPLWTGGEPDLRRHARFLAKRGVNMVRLHAHINPDPEKQRGAPITAIDPGERDWIWRTVAAMKQEGIYVTVSPYWPNTMKFDAAWGIAGGPNQPAHGLLFFDAKLQAAYRAWLRALLKEPNPYTGIPLARDPTLAIFQIQNEDSLLFWTVNNVKAEQRRELGRRFAAWSAKQHGSIAAALQRWENDRLPGDDPAAGALDFHNIWEMTQERRGGRVRRLADQLRFWAETMHAFHRETARYLREELGCRQLINAGNWKTADDLRLNDVERWTYTANEVLAVNRYFTGVHDGPHKGWAIVRGDTFTSPSALLDPLQLPLNLRQVRGRPMLVTESCWVPPAGHAVEGPFLVAAYQSLTGIDGYYWFSTGDEQWTPPQSANGYLQSQQKWLFGAPETLGSFPAAALLYRKGLVKQGRPVLFEQRSLEELWERRPPALPEGSGFDPNRDAARRGDAAPGGVSPYAYLAGPVEVAFADRSAPPKVEPLETWIDAARKTVTSVTGEVRLDWGKGICTVDAPRAQGAAGFFRNASDVRLRDLQLRAGSEYGAVLAVSLDDRDLAQSRRVLVQAAAPSRPTGWKQSPVQPGEPFGPRTLFRVDDFGGPPWQVTALNLEVKVRSSLLSRAQPLDANGYGAGPAIPLAAGGEWRSFRFPAGTMHVLLE